MKGRGARGRREAAAAANLGTSRQSKVGVMHGHWWARGTAIGGFRAAGQRETREGGEESQCTTLTASPRAACFFPFSFPPYLPPIFLPAATSILNSNPSQPAFSRLPPSFSRLKLASIVGTNTWP